MKKLIMFLCILIMFFGIVGCPRDNNSLVTPTTSNLVSKPSQDTNGNGSIPIGGNGNTVPNEGNGSNPSQVPEPTTLILLGTGLVGLAGYGRKRLKK